MKQIWPLGTFWCICAGTTLTVGPEPVQGGWCLLLSLECVWKPERQHHQASSLVKKLISTGRCLPIASGLHSALCFQSFLVIPNCLGGTRRNLQEPCLLQQPCTKTWSRVAGNATSSRQGLLKGRFIFSLLLLFLVSICLGAVCSPSRKANTS